MKTITLIVLAVFLTLNVFSQYRDHNTSAVNKKEVKDLSISKKGIAFIKSYEKFKNKLYNDDAGNTTIGYGHLVHLGKLRTDTLSEKEFKKGITEKQAHKILLHDIQSKAEKCIKKYVTIKLSQNQFDALVSLSFNIDCYRFRKSTLLDKVNNKEKDAAVITKWFKAWNKGTVNGSRIEFKGLTTRRGQEADMYNKNIYNSKH